MAKISLKLPQIVIRRPQFQREEEYRQVQDFATVVRQFFGDIAKAVNLIYAAPAAPTSLTVNTGTLAAGTAADLATPGGTTVQVNETATTPGFDVEFGFTGLRQAAGIRFLGFYDGNLAHDPDIEIYNHLTSSWDFVVDLIDGSRNELQSVRLPLDTYVSTTGVATVRVYHYHAGSVGHHLFVDYIGIEEV